MSRAEDASEPLPVLVKLAVMLRNVPWVQFVFAKLAALLRGNKASREPLIRDFPGEAPGVTTSTVDQAVAEPETNDQADREKLIRRRWAETGIKMWNPDVHGAGRAALNIQGQVELLPAESGGTLPRYDKLEFKLVRSCVDGQAVNHIVCEGVVVDPPTRRTRQQSVSVE